MIRDMHMKPRDIILWIAKIGEVREEIHDAAIDASDKNRGA